MAFRNLSQNKKQDAKLAHANFHLFISFSYK